MSLLCKDCCLIKFSVEAAMSIMPLCHDWLDGIDTEDMHVSLELTCGGDMQLPITSSWVPP